MQTIRALLHQAQQGLLPVSTSPELDAKVLLALALKVARSYLLAYPEYIPNPEQAYLFDTLLQERLKGKPIAYITGRQEFWSLALEVNAATLIPRPETELLVETALQYLCKESSLHIVDLGTGSGAIAIALAKECPRWQLYATDQSAAALATAKANAAALQVSNIQFFQGDWCHALPLRHYHAIISNPPYLAPSDPHLAQGDLRFEPNTALIAEDEGFADLITIIKQAKDYLYPQAYLLLEHGFTQQATLLQHLRQHGYVDCQGLTDLAGLDRVTLGVWLGSGVKR